MPKVSRLFVLCASVLVAEGVALAQNAPPPGPAPAATMTVPRGFHMHDGFFLRFTPGFGGAASGASQGGTDVTISGGGFAGAAAIGTAINPNLVLCAETTLISTSDPTVEVNGDSTEVAGAEYLVQYLGIGASYYLPTNVYLHGGIGALWMGLKGPDDAEIDWTDAGFALKGAIGKEWWASDNWGLGVAAALLIGSVTEEDVDWTTAIVSFNFSATYN